MHPVTGSVEGYNCGVCGTFELTDLAKSCIPGFLEKDKRFRAVASHHIRKSQSGLDQVPRFNEASLTALIGAPLPRPKEQADQLIREIGTHSSELGNAVSLDLKQIGAVIGAISDRTAIEILKQLRAANMIEFENPIMADKARSLRLTFAGWEHYESLKLADRHYAKAFMAMKFGNRKLEKVVATVFKPAVKQTGFDLIRLDEKPQAGLIDDRLRVEIRSSDFLIADLTHENAGAYWEAGFAEGLGKPVIYTCEKSKFKRDSTHFDTNHHLTVLWDPKCPDESAALLKATIRATLPARAKQLDP